LLLTGALNERPALVIICKTVGSGADVGFDAADADDDIFGA
jgi:hypothetical protein